MLRIPLPQPANYSADSCIPESELTNLLPASYCPGRKKRKRPKDQIADFLENEFDLQRLNNMHHKLWFAGGPIPGLALHEWIMMGKFIAVTEQADLHLAWHYDKIYIKPLPRFLLHYRFWSENIVQRTELYGRALGFLVTYVWLIARESDFRIAVEKFLLPCDLSWYEWIPIATAIMQEENSIFINKRYRFGSLSLEKLNAMYLYERHVGSCEYRRENVETDVLIRAKLPYIGVAFALITITLAAMQVGLGTDRLGKSDLFQEVSLGVAIFLVAVPVALLAVGLSLYIGSRIYYFSRNVWTGIQERKANARN